MHSITLRHNFETAHRLPHLGGKCSNLHGHSWWVDVRLSADDLSRDLTVVEFGQFKKVMRGWIDTRIDHATMLGEDDPLVDTLVSLGCNVYVFGPDWKGAKWPTVEAVAEMFGAQALEWLNEIPDLPLGVAVAGIKVSETHINTAEWVTS